jgi:hypothetical protein
MLPLLLLLQCASRLLTVACLQLLSSSCPSQQGHHPTVRHLAAKQRQLCCQLLLLRT